MGKKTIHQHIEGKIMKIFKYKIPVCDDIFSIDMPSGSNILSFKLQEDHPMLWAIVLPERNLEKRFFRIYATGDEMEKGHHNYIGTIIVPCRIVNASMVWHLFEV